MGLTIKEPEPPSPSKDRDTMAAEAERQECEIAALVLVRLAEELAARTRSGIDGKLEGRANEPSAEKEVCRRDVNEDELEQLWCVQNARRGLQFVPGDPQFNVARDAELLDGLALSADDRIQRGELRARDTSGCEHLTQELLELA